MWVRGIGLEITPDGIIPDPEVLRYSAHFKENVSVWLPNQVIPQDRAISDIVEMVVDDHRSSRIYQQFPSERHYLFGEIFRKYVAPKNNDELTPYDDAKDHVDFVPPDNHCRGYFLSKNNPTIGYQGNFKYRGILTKNYADEGQDNFTINPTVTVLKSGNLWVTPDARTFRHGQNIRTPGERTFGRFFAGLKPG